MIYIIPKYRVKIRRARIGVYRIEYFSHFHNIDSNTLHGVDNTEIDIYLKKEMSEFFCCAEVDQLVAT